MGKHVIREGKSKQIDRQYLPWKKWNVEASYTILSSSLTWALCVRLTVFKVATGCRANGAHKRRHLVSDLLRLERRLARSIAATCPGCSAFSSLVVYPGDPEDIVCLLRASLESREVVSSPLGCGVECAGWDCGNEGRDSRCMRCTIAGRFHVLKECRWLWHCSGVGESNWPRLAEAFGPTERGHFASAIVRRYRTGPPPNSAGYPMAIPALWVA